MTKDFTEFNWNDLRYFLTMVRAGNPTRAAKMLAVDHTTVRRRIQSLESELKMALFHKHDDRYVLSPQGESLLQHAETIESTINVARNELTHADAKVSGTIRIGAPDGLGSFFLSPRLVKLRTANPGLKIELAAMSRQFDLSTREADIAIVLARPTQGRHLIRKLTDCTLYLYASQEYLSRHPPIRSTDDLHLHQFVGYTDQIDFTPELDPASPAFEELSRPMFASTNLVAQYQATLAGGGLCLLPRFMFEHGTSLQCVLPEQINVTREHWLLIHADSRSLARCRIATEFILDEVGKARHLFC